MGRAIELDAAAHKVYEPCNAILSLFLLQLNGKHHIVEKRHPELRQM